MSGFSVCYPPGVLSPSPDDSLMGKKGQCTAQVLLLASTDKPEVRGLEERASREEALDSAGL